MAQRHHVGRLWVFLRTSISATVSQIMRMSLSSSDSVERAQRDVSRRPECSTSCRFDRDHPPDAAGDARARRFASYQR